MDSPFNALLAGLIGRAPAAAPPEPDYAAPELPSNTQGGGQGQGFLAGLMSSLSDAKDSISSGYNEAVLPARAHMAAEGVAPGLMPATVGGTAASSPGVNADRRASTLPSPAGTAVEFGKPQVVSGDGVRRLFAPAASGGEQRPTAAAGSISTPWQTTVKPAESQGGVSPADVQSFVRALMSGAAGVNPQAPKFAAFAQGAAGSMNTLYSEQEKAKQQAAAQAKQNLADMLALRKDGREERGANRADQDSALKATDQVRKNKESDARIEKLKAEADRFKNRNLSPENVIAVENWLQRAEKAHRDAGKVDKELDETIKGLRQRMGRQIQSGKLEVPGEQKAGASADAPAKPASKADFDQLPSGSYYLNPADGKIYQKK